MYGMQKSKASLTYCVALMLSGCTALTTGIGTIFGVVEVGEGEYVAANRTMLWGWDNQRKLLSGAELEAVEFCSKQSKTAQIIEYAYVPCGHGCADYGKVRFRCIAKQ